MPINLFALLVAPKGSGKTPASKVLLAPLSALEKEERRDYDEKRIKKKKKTVGKKRKIEEQEDDLDEEYDEVFDDEKDTDVEEKGKKDEVEEHRKKAKIEENRQKDDEHSSLFHAKTRICETITSEALIETLRHNSGSLLLKTDEFKVRFIVNKVSTYILFFHRGGWTGWLPRLILRVPSAPPLLAKTSSTLP